MLYIERRGVHEVDHWPRKAQLRNYLFIIKERRGVHEVEHWTRDPELRN